MSEYFLYMRHLISSCSVRGIALKRGGGGEQPDLILTFMPEYV